MTSQPIDELLATAPQVSESEWNSICMDVAIETVEAVQDYIAEAFETLQVSPGVEMKPRDRLEWFLVRLLAAYPNDRIGMLNETALLLDKGYVQMIKTGQAPPPIAMPWAGALNNGILFKSMQKVFKKHYDSQTKLLFQEQPARETTSPPAEPVAY